MDNDASYKKLFSHPQMVEDLLRGFVHEPWVAEVDFTTLEKVSGSYVTDDLREREDDIIWRLRLRDGWLYVYLLLEFQSAVDRYMAVRVMAYEALLYQDLISRREHSADGLLPPVVPVVLYNGHWRWHAPVEVALLIAHGPGGLEAYRPQMRYLLIDEGALAESELAPLRNLVAALFQLENSRQPEDVRRVIERLIEWLGAPEQMELRRAFTVWIKRVLLPKRLPGVEVPEVRDLQEVRGMLEERVIEWTRDWKEQGMQEGRRIGIQEGRQEGRQQGRQEGRQEGLQQSARQSVLDALEIRFGLAALAVQRSVERVDDPARLRLLHRQAMLVPSLEAFELTLAQYGGNGDSALN